MEDVSIKRALLSVSDKTGLVRFEPGSINNIANAPPAIFINQIKINPEQFPKSLKKDFLKELILKF